MELLNDLAVFLANPPGNLVFFLAVVFTLFGAIQGAISQSRIVGSRQASRLLAGLIVLISIQLLLFFTSGLIDQGIIQGSLFLPVMDRAAMVLSIIWIIWLWVFPEKTSAGDAATILLSLLVLAAAIFGSVLYLSSDPVLGTFNLSDQAFYWSLGGSIILFFGLILIIFKKPIDWGSGLSVILLPLIGFIFDTVYPSKTGDYSGILRFFLLATFPLLFSLPSRNFSGIGNLQIPSIADVASLEIEQNNSQKISETSFDSRERRKYSTDPKTIHALLALAAESDSTRVNQYIVRSVAHSLLVDLCFLIYLNDDENTLFISTGYDLIREENLEGGIISREVVPMLANSVQRGRPLLLQANTTSSDIKGLGELLGLTNPGNLLNVPILSEKGPVGSILLLSPYSNRVWNPEDQALLTDIANSFYPIIERSHRITNGDQDRDRAIATAKDAIEQAFKLKTSNAELASQISVLKSQLEQTREEIENQAELLAKSKENQASANISSLTDENSKSTVIASSNPQLEMELRQTLLEMARLQNQVAESNSKIIKLQNKSSGPANSDQTEVIASISQELRQPMTSIIGYADLLLGESVGILGALQRKFIERIRTSTERIGSLVDDLIRINHLESESFNVNLETIDLNLIIDNAMAYTSSQMREKNITMRIDIPENLLPLHADREALQQILIHLLQNAGAASPIEGSVTLRVRTQSENAQEHVIIQVSDTGGGIPREELSRVFSRLYRAENALI